MPLIKEQLETFDELAPFVKMIVSPNGVTVGDLAFVSAQTVSSSALTKITAANTVNGDLSLDLFQSAIGDVGQGYATALTRSEGSWLDSAGRLPANQVFVGISCGFQAYLRSTDSTTDTTAAVTLIRNVPALQAIGQALTWDLTVGDGITRTIGSIGAYGGLGGITGAVPLAGVTVTSGQGAFNTTTTLAGAAGVMLGDPCNEGVRLRVPLIFPPNINVRIKVRNGNLFKVEQYANAAGAAADTLPANSFLCIKQYIRGYLCTMPV